MTQQLIAVLFIFFFIFRLFWQKRSKNISANEFVFWLVFWLGTLLAVLFIKKIDRFVARLGFSASGIEVLLYLAVALLFYLFFRIRLRLAKMQEQISALVTALALKDDNKKVSKQ